MRTFGGWKRRRTSVVAPLLMLGLAAVASLGVAASASTSFSGPRLGQPTGLTAVVTGQEVDLSWLAVPEATRYRVADTEQGFGHTSATTIEVRVSTTGRYTFEVCADASGYRESSPAVLTVHVTGSLTPTPTLSPSPVTAGTPTASPTPTATPTSSSASASAPRPTPTPAPTVLSIAVSGNHLVDQQGNTVVLRGADTSGTEYACDFEDSIFDGTAEASPASIAAMEAWGFNAARVNLNESCWLGVQGVPAAYSGAAYQTAIETYVDELEAAGMYVIVDEHFSTTGGSADAQGQEPMPDAAYSLTFWKSVASAFKANHAVIFDLFNEPYPNNNTDSAAAWTCDLEGSAGGTCSGFSYPAAGMQAMLNAVRATGATNVVMVGGPQYAGDVDQWLAYEPVDSLRPAQLAASIHVYWWSVSRPDWSPCYTSSCWTGQIAPLAEVVPVVTGEFGEMDCGDTLYPPYLDFADANGVSYLAWAWFAGDCDGPSLLGTSQSDYASGTPSAEGVAYRQHLEALGLGTS